MKETPLLFSTEMVKALLAGRKTVTRRMSGLDAVNENPDDWVCCEAPEEYGFIFLHESNKSVFKFVKPKVQVGDMIWVRETWIGGEKVIYKADGHDCFRYDGSSPWKPSIHMPKSAARIWLECTEVSVERLQDITEEDAIAEGVESGQYYNEGLRWKNYQFGLLEPAEHWGPKESFASLIDSVNEVGTWERNPWVFTIHFRILSKNGRA